ncbi:MAG: histidine--tRNA ligase [Candidatus Odinarchaeia archaeon]
MNDLRAVKGMRDYLAEDKLKLNYINRIIRKLFNLYSYSEVSTPIVEHFDLLASKAGDEIREKMYVFEDKAHRILALRPEMTAPIARLYINSLMKSAPKPVRLGYIGTCYRYDNPQMGRWREFWQAGFELFGSNNPESDIEILMIAYDMMKNLGFSDFKIRVGHIGVLRSFLTQLNVDSSTQDRLMGLLDLNNHEEIEKELVRLNISEDDKEVFYSFLEIKTPDVKEGFTALVKLMKNYEECGKDIENFEEILDLIPAGLKEYIEIDMSLARGLEYYTGMIFEVFVEGLRIAVGGGGRYNKLIEVFGGEPTPAVGFAAGLDRLIMAMEKKKLFSIKNPSKTLLLPLNIKQLKYAFKVAKKLRELGLALELDVLRRNIRRALKFAIDNNYDFIIFLGEKEEENKKVTVKNLKSGKQETVSVEEVNKIIPQSVTLL